MFELLDNPAPPVPTEAQRSAVVRAGSVRRARRRRARAAASTTVLLAGGLAGAVALSDAGPSAVVEAVSSPETTATPAETTSPPTTAEATTTTVHATTTVPPTTTTTLRTEPQATGYGTPSVPPRPGVRLRLRLDRTSFAAGETLEAVLRIENGSAEDVVINRNHCPPVVYAGLYRDGQWKGGDEGGACIPEGPPPLVIPPGKAYETPFQLDAYGGTNADGTTRHLPPGTYQASAAIRQGGQGQFAWFAPSVDVELR